MIFLWIGIGIVLLVGFLLVVPVAVIYDRPALEEPIRAEFQWLYGAVHISLTKRRERKEKTRKDEKKAGKKRKEKKKRRSRRLPDDISGLFRSVVNLIRRILGSVRINLQGDIYLGLPDPADTGQYWGMAYPLIHRLESLGDVRIHPSFPAARADFIGHADVHVIPLYVVSPVVRFVISSRGRRIIKTLRGAP